jgi:hypothetical protein
LARHQCEGGPGSREIASGKLNVIVLSTDSTSRGASASVYAMQELVK